ncbi:MAG: hypothetical protein U0531_19745 [Dehalococcoidia bacterium]
MAAQVAGERLRRRFDVAFRRFGHARSSSPRRRTRWRGRFHAADSVVENTTFGSARSRRIGASSSRAMVLVGGLPVQHELVQPSSQQMDAGLAYFIGG